MHFGFKSPYSSFIVLSFEMEINYAMTVLRKYISPAWRAGDFKNLNVFLKAWARSEDNPEICAKFFLNSENAGDGVAGNNFIIVFVSVDGVRIKVIEPLVCALNMWAFGFFENWEKYGRQTLQ